MPPPAPPSFGAGKGVGLENASLIVLPHMALRCQCNSKCRAIFERMEAGRPSPQWCD